MDRYAYALILFCQSDNEFRGEQKAQMRGEKNDNGHDVLRCTMTECGARRLRRMEKVKHRLTMNYANEQTS